MTGQDWTTGRKNAGLTQVHAAKALGISQPYLSQLEKGSRTGSPVLEKHAAAFYRLPPTVLPLPEQQDCVQVKPDHLQNELAALGYPGFAHVSSNKKPTRQRCSSLRSLSEIWILDWLKRSPGSFARTPSWIGPGCAIVQSCSTFRIG